MTYENLDEKLIDELLGDGRASLRHLGEELDVSVTTISNHLSDLEDEGVIEGYTPQINYDALGYDVTAIFNLQVKGDQLDTITERLNDQEQIMTVYEVTGDNDITAIGKFKDTDGMNDQIKEILSDDGVLQSNTNVVLNSVSENRQFSVAPDRI